MEDKNWFYSLFDHLAGFLVSLALLILVFFAFMGYRYYEVQTLFQDSLQQIDPAQDWSTASILIALVIIITTMIFMTNAEKLDAIFQSGEVPPSKGGAGTAGGSFSPSKITLVLFALAINLFFWKPWAAITTAELMQRLFYCLMLSSMDYAFAHLFNALRLERSRRTEVFTLRNDLELLQESYKERLAKSEKLEAYINAHTCPYCKEPFPSPKATNAHKGRCKHKPQQS